LGIHFLQPEVRDVLWMNVWDELTAGKHIQELLPRYWKIERWAAGRGATVQWSDGRQVGQTTRLCMSLDVWNNL
jgi:hypothetical protein